MNEPSNNTVSVIVVTCGISNYIKTCLESLKSQTCLDLEIIVIDNSLNQEFDQNIRKGYPLIKFYSNSRNLFYCQALNQGIKLSQGDFTLCLNDDVILDAKFIEKAIKGFFVNDKIGMVSGKILRFDKKTLDSTGLFLSPWRTAKERGYGLIDKGDFQNEGYIFGVNGAVAFYRKSMLEEIKEGDDYFDVNFRMFYEDLDLAWRAKRFGWRGYYIPEAIAYHLRGGSARRGVGVNKSYARRYLDDELHADLIKNRYLAIIKNEKRLDFLLHIPFIFLYEIFLWSYILFFRSQQIKMFFLNLKYPKVAYLKRKLDRIK